MCLLFKIEDFIKAFVCNFLVRLLKYFFFKLSFFKVAQKNSNPLFSLTALSCPNGPDRIIYVPKCGLQTNYIYNWILRNSFISQNSINRDQLKKIIETCKTLYSEFDDKRREIRAEKAKRIRELTDPDHAWDAVPEEGGAMSPTFGGQYRIRHQIDYQVGFNGLS